MDLEPKEDKRFGGKRTGRKVKKILVEFISEEVKKKFESLKEGKFEDRRLHGFISRAIADLEKDPESGTKIPNKFWPRFYVQKYVVSNLWKYDLPNGWRLIYTIETNEVKIVGIILEWFDHKNYEKRFRY